jgi:secondary thiamine-phosphate synthase enzyme
VKTSSVKIHTEDIPVSTNGETEIIDVTDAVEGCVRASGVAEGHVMVFSPGSTVGITTVEYEPGLVKDLQEAFERLAPRKAAYHHEETWHDGNGYAHVRASLLGQSRVFPVRGGKLFRGTWQQVIFIDFDNRPRKRTVTVQVLGQ